ncbi:MAG: hypothetical protein MZW92_04780 [Comamonadaceae bacterium]|nr:hypothetical protein [Comamonadaceae bacterium]
MVARALRARGRTADSGGRFSWLKERARSPGLTDDEAQEFHKYYVQGFVGFTADRRGRPHPGLDLASLALSP